MHITDPTSSLIDLIYTNFPDKVACSGVCHVSMSDHRLAFTYRYSMVRTSLKVTILKRMYVSRISIETVLTAISYLKTGLIIPYSNTEVLFI